MTIRNYAIGALLLLVLACVTYIRYVSIQLADSRASGRSIALRASNIQALHDTTRNIALENARVAKILGDSLHGYERLVVQQHAPPDAIDSAGASRRAAAYQIGYKIGSFLGTITRAWRDTVIPFHLRQEPFTADATVSHVEAGDSVTLHLDVALDTISLTARVQCSAPGDGGIHAASIMTTAPPWATVRFGDVRQDPEVCNPITPSTAPPRRLVSWAPVALSVGRQVGPGNAGWSMQIGTALIFGK